MSKRRNRKKKGGLDLIWLVCLPLLLTAAILLALSIWSQTESALTHTLGEHASSKPTVDDLYRILEE